MGLHFCGHPVEDGLLLACLGRLPALQLLSLDNSRKLSVHFLGALCSATGTAPGASARAWPCRARAWPDPACPAPAGPGGSMVSRLEALSLQRCFQLDARALAAILAACTLEGGTPGPLATLCMSHLTRLHGLTELAPGPAGPACTGAPRRRVRVCKRGNAKRLLHGH